MGLLIPRNTAPKGFAAAPNFFLPFSSGVQFSRAILEAVGYDVRVYQLTSGLLSARATLSAEGHWVFLKIETNQDLLFEGDRNNDLTPICLEGARNGEVVVHDTITSECGLFGFRGGGHYTDTFFSLKAGQVALIALGPTQEVVGTMLQLGMHEAAERTLTHNHIQLTVGGFEDMRARFEISLNTPAIEPNAALARNTQWQTAIAEAIAFGHIRREELLTEELNLMKRVMAYGQERDLMNGLPTLKELSKVLQFCENTSRSKASKLLALSPTTLLRIMRLESFRTFVSDPERREKYKLRRPADVYRHFGISTGSFGDTYKKHFGETVNQTFKKNTMATGQLWLPM